MSVWSHFRSLQGFHLCVYMRSESKCRPAAVSALYSSLILLSVYPHSFPFLIPVSQDSIINSDLSCKPDHERWDPTDPSGILPLGLPLTRPKPPAVFLALYKQRWEPVRPAHSRRQTLHFTHSTSSQRGMTVCCPQCKHATSSSVRTG